MRILIVKLGAIGDVVHTLPALAALRRAQPAAHIAWAVERGGAALLLRDNPCLDDLIELDLRGWRRGLTQAATRAAISAALAQLRGARFDAALDFQGLLKSAMVTRLSGARRRVGFAAGVARESASALLMTERVAADDREHVIKKNLALVAQLGCDVSGAYEFPLAVAPADERFAAEQAARFGDRFVIVNPSGGWPTKLWRPEYFGEIADRLRQIHGLRAAVTYGPGEASLARAVVENARGSAVMLDSTLPQFFALARRAQLFIGGDTGPMHLAAAAGTPIVALFGPTSARRNGPFAAHDIVVERFDLACRSDCYRRSCSHTSCMNIPVETVWRAATERMRKAEGGGRKAELPVLHSAV